MTDRLQIDQPILRLVVEGRDFSGKAKTCQNQVVTARARMPKPIRCSGALLGGPHVQDSTATRVFLFSARRATDRSPRREPWVPPDTNIISPEGATHSALGQGRMSHEPHLGCVAPPGLRGVSRPFPTAHAVGYDLPPSELRTNSHRAFSQNESDLLGRRHSKTATSPKHRMSQDQSSRPPACCGLAPNEKSPGCGTTGAARFKYQSVTSSGRWPSACWRCRLVRTRSCGPCRPASSLRGRA